MAAGTGFVWRRTAADWRRQMSEKGRKMERLRNERQGGEELELVDCSRDQSFYLGWRKTSWDGMDNMVTECRGQKGKPIDSLSPNGLQKIRVQGSEFGHNSETKIQLKHTRIQTQIHIHLLQIQQPLADLSPFNLSGKHILMIKPTSLTTRQPQFI